jgi:hypothetical protein
MSLVCDFAAPTLPPATIIPTDHSHFRSESAALYLSDAMLAHAGILSLPNELLDVIVSLIPIYERFNNTNVDVITSASRKDLHSLTLTCRRLYRASTPLLWSRVRITTLEMWQSFLRATGQREDLASYVQGYLCVTWRIFEFRTTENGEKVPIDSSFCWAELRIPELPNCVRLELEYQTQHELLEPDLESQGVLPIMEIYHWIMLCPRITTLKICGKWAHIDVPATSQFDVPSRIPASLTNYEFDALTMESSRWGPLLTNLPEPCRLTLSSSVEESVVPALILIATDLATLEIVSGSSKHSWQPDVAEGGGAVTLRSVFPRLQRLVCPLDLHEVWIQKWPCLRALELIVNVHLYPPTRDGLNSQLGCIPAVLRSGIMPRLRNVWIRSVDCKCAECEGNPLDRAPEWTMAGPQISNACMELGIELRVNLVVK